MLPLEEITLRLGIAALFGMVLGLEREAKEKPAGLRTYMLVSIGASAFALATQGVVAQFAQMEEVMRMDPTRVVEGIIGGIGFLGAGAIIQSQGKVRGVTTGAGIWVAGAIGLSCGFGLYVLSGIVTGFSLFIMLVLGALEHKFFGNNKSQG